MFGGHEEIVMLAVAKCEPHATGETIVRALAEAVGEPPDENAVWLALGKLVMLRMVKAGMPKAASVLDNQAVLFTVTARGWLRLADAEEVRKRLRFGLVPKKGEG